MRVARVVRHPAGETFDVLLRDPASVLPAPWCDTCQRHVDKVQRTFLPGVMAVTAFCHGQSERVHMPLHLLRLAEMLELGVAFARSEDCAVDAAQYAWHNLSQNWREDINRRRQAHGMQPIDWSQR